MNEKSVHVLEDSHIEIVCNIEASPRPVSYWIKEPLGRNFYQSYEDPRQNVLQESDKYAMNESVHSHYKATMRLKISNFSESDVGVYTCIASNVMGRDNGTIRLYGKCLTIFALPIGINLQPHPSRFQRRRQSLWEDVKRFSDLHVA